MASKSSFSSSSSDCCCSCCSTATSSSSSISMSSPLFFSSFSFLTSSSSIFSILVAPSCLLISFTDSNNAVYFSSSLTSSPFSNSCVLFPNLTLTFSSSLLTLKIFTISLVPFFKTWLKLANSSICSLHSESFGASIPIYRQPLILITALSFLSKASTDPSTTNPSVRFSNSSGNPYFTTLSLNEASILPSSWTLTILPITSLFLNNSISGLSIKSSLNSDSFARTTESDASLMKHPFAFVWWTNPRNTMSVFKLPIPSFKMRARRSPCSSISLKSFL